MNLVFDLLQVALGTRDRLSQVPKPCEWISLYNESVRQSIVGILMGGLERLPVEQLPSPEIKYKWIGTVHTIESSTELNRTRSNELVEIVKTAGFNSCVLKGVAVARYYPNPMRRQCGDIDLWTFGYRKDVMSWLSEKFSITHKVWHNVGVKVFNDVPVEIHFHPAWLYNPLFNYRLQRFFEREKRVINTQNDKSGINVMPPGFDAVFSLVHTYRHLISGGVGLRHIIDYYYICKHVEESGLQEAVINQIRFLGLQRIAAAMMWVLKTACGMPDKYMLVEPNENEGGFLLEEINRGGNFGHHTMDTKPRGLIRQLLTMLPHYPREVLWVIPWKIWHSGWRLMNR